MRRRTPSMRVSRTHQIDLSIIIVNYNVATLVLEAVASVERQRFAAPDEGVGHLEIIVIDNASTPEDVERLEGLPSGVALVKNERNVGFAAANNQGIELAAGRYLCFLNPDTKVLDGALQALLQHLYRHPEVGAVGPLFWADDERTLRLSPAEPPTLSFLLSRMLANSVPAIGRMLSRCWYRSVLAWWRDRMSIAVPVLPGACIVTSRDVLDRVGGFDPGYFLYYEDTDWCRRVRLAGYDLVCVQGAEVVHYYHQSAKADRAAAVNHALQSQHRFVEIHYGRLGMMAYRAVQAFSGCAVRWWPPAPLRVVDLGSCVEPPRFRMAAAPTARDLMLQIGLDNIFIPSATAFVRAAEFRLPSAVWDRLHSGRYYARLADPETLRTLALWSWQKG